MNNEQKTRDKRGWGWERRSCQWSDDGLAEELLVVVTLNRSMEMD